MSASASGDCADRLENLRQTPMLGQQAIFAGLILQEVANRIVKPQNAPIEIEIEKQREIVKPAQQILGFKLDEAAGLGPKPRDDANRDVGVFGKDAELAKTRALVLIEEVEADPDRAGDGLGALSFIARIESDEALGVEPLVGA